MDHLHRASPPPGKTSSDRAFGGVFAVVFALLGGWPLLDGAPPHLWAWALALGFAFVALLRPTWLAPLNRLWTRFGLFLHKIVNPLVLGVIFLVAILPIGLLFKLLGKDPMRLRRRPDAGSYWIERHPPGPAADSLPRQF
jgi:hypothetical protein